MITIHKPTIRTENGKSRLESSVSIDNFSGVLWFEVESKFGPYLCHERGDAFLVALLNYAMRNGHDITSEAPIGEDLYYRLSTDLIPALANNSKVLHLTKITAAVDSSILPNAQAVGTGISCGVDSLHAVAQESNPNFPRHKLTHLAFNNVGSHGAGERAQKLFDERRALAKKFCEEYHYEYVEGNSNLQDFIPQSHFLSHTYSSIFSVLALQKLYSVYYYASSGHKYNSFSIKDSEKYDSGLYELLSLNCFSSHSLKIYSEGGEKNRFEKLQSVVKFEPSYKYLNVCVKQFHNCGKCEKCVRTLVAIDALNCLEKYKTVFDINYYKQNRSYYYTKLVVGTLEKNEMYEGVYPLLKNKISFVSNVRGGVNFCLRSMKKVLVSILPKPIKNLLKKFLKKRSP